jgi:hypothetical protein
MYYNLLPYLLLNLVIPPHQSTPQKIISKKATKKLNIELD